MRTCSRVGVIDPRELQKVNASRPHCFVIDSTFTTTLMKFRAPGLRTRPC
jgi:hypothetical protein